MMGVGVKICGLTRPSDAVAVANIHPDFVGLVFASGRRQVDLVTAAKLTSILPGGIHRVGVFCDATVNEMIAAVQVCGLDVLQLHGLESPQLTDELRCRFADLPHPVRIWKTLAASPGKTEDLLPSALRYGGSADALLLDAGRTGRIPSGGSGQRVDWNAAARLVRQQPLPVILAGGLDPDCVADAIREVRPYAVDVSSGVETDGKKDSAKILEFVKMVRETTGEQV